MVLPSICRNLTTGGSLCTAAECSLLVHQNKLLSLQHASSGGVYHVEGDGSRLSGMP